MSESGRGWRVSAPEDSKNSFDEGFIADMESVAHTVAALKAQLAEARQFQLDVVSENEAWVKDNVALRTQLAEAQATVERLQDELSARTIAPFIGRITPPTKEQP